MSRSSKFHVGLTRDFLAEDGRLAFQDIGLGMLDAEPGVTYSFLPENLPEITPDQIAGFDGVITYLPKWTAESFAGNDRLAVLARFGVGYDMVDVAACTQSDVVLAITPDGVRRPMAEGTLTLLLASAKGLFAKSRVLREGRWMDHKFIYGTCLSGKTVGTVGLGNIARDLMALLKPFGLAQRLAFDPYCPQEQAQGLGVQLVDLERLLRESDFVCINCLLNDETRGLIGKKEFGLMKSTAYLVNTARGPIVNADALVEALRTKQIRGAALDVFDVEPISKDDPLLALDNAILLPHAIGWTHEALLGNGQGACEAMLNVYRGRPPGYVVNRDVLERPSFRKKLEKFGQ